MKMYIKAQENLGGKIMISGSKNASLPIICTCLLTKEEVTLYNIPNILDIINLLKILTKIGVSIKKDNNVLVLNAKKVSTNVLIKEVAQIRASYYIMGALIARKKKMKIFSPGGCSIGSRPIDYHLMAFKKLGIKVNKQENIYILKRKKLNSCEIEFKRKSVGATINAIFASVKSKNRVKIINPSFDYEVLEVIECLRKMKASIDIIDDTIIINPIKRLFGYSHVISFDRIEASSYMLLATIKENTKLELIGLGKRCIYEEILASTIEVLKNMGHVIVPVDNKIIIISQKTNPISVNTGPSPAFPTDLQPILTSALLVADGESEIQENVFENRFSHVKNLILLGANIIIENQKIIINKSILSTGSVKAEDLRCGFALIVAGLMIKDGLTIDNFEIVNRGYENIRKKLENIGVVTIEK